MRRFFFHLKPLQALALGFAAIILIGALLLSLPVCSRDGHALPFLNALFTATSATCVTGLVVYDTFTHFTFVGQLVLLLLIQIGGLGFMTIAVLLSMLARRRIGLRERSFLMESVSSLQLGGVVHMVKRILIGTALIEGAGALLLMARFIPLFGLRDGVWFSLFHAISAFCNAGFDLMGCIAPYASLTPFVDDAYVCLVIASLIVIGGIGFLVWNDFVQHKHHFRKYRLHSKLILTATAGTLFVSTLLFLILERNNTQAGMSFGGRLLASFFQAVTPRTAGFNTVEMSALSEGGSMLTLLLMFVGAGPGSTGGGVKLTTFFVMLLSTLAYTHGRNEVDIFARRVPSVAVTKAFSATMLYAVFAFLGCFILVTVQPMPFLDAVFESFSAIGTVGLSTGITRTLQPVSRFIMILLMYAGRVGSLSFVMAVSERNLPKLKLPEEGIII